MTVMRIAHLLTGIVFLGTAIGAIAAGMPSAPAGGGGLPQITATSIFHDVNHCTQQGGVASCYTTTETRIKVTGAGFTADGPVRVQILDAQTHVYYLDTTIQAGDHGAFSLDTTH